MQPIRVTAALVTVYGVVTSMPSAAFAQEPPKVQAGGGYMYIIRGLHVATDVMRVQRPFDFSAWTFRIAAGVMLPGR